MENLIINFAPTGMIPTKKQTPYVPISPKEIIDDVSNSTKFGVSIAHLHARDDQGAPTYRKEVYEEIIYGIREKHPDLILVTTTSGRNYNEFEKRSAVLELTGDLKPDMASLTLSSLNFPKTASINSPEMILKLAEKMQNNGIKPELEVFDLGMINFAKYMIKKGLLTPPYYFNILLGNISSAQAKLNHLALLISELPDQSYYSLTGIGDTQKSMVGLGVLMADGVRIGLEDNIWLDKKKNILAKNSDLLERVVNLAKAYERNIASPLEVKSKLKL
ncbi:3-keto-5-aminohexanoate cleavage protein [Bacillus suaedaesalsae]|uniref:3-keto-5-aminohexanoate cleavage protein n=1 Tax=Bacillus suaedaesalsae TaxID=2810349 RepID=A0ABS2DIA0_9BACI|nr:3-keto-5-aminohexanoate cleavage protein [Bacillus suaedaesalsae]MBM6618227.1 3-keto-5-aminohexanoate cleavage protein [Bacillus suaedaesalsae]